MYREIGIIAQRYALPASLLLLLSFFIRHIGGFYYEKQVLIIGINLAIESVVILLFSYRSLRSLNELSEETTPGYASLFLLFNWTSLLISLLYITFCFLFFTVLDPGSWTDTSLFFHSTMQMEVRPGQFLLMQLLFYLNFSVIWSAIYLGVKRKFNYPKK
jgi:hypothetical protein